jgi:hypothetical protein
MFKTKEYPGILEIPYLLKILTCSPLACILDRRGLSSSSSALTGEVNRLAELLAIPPATGVSPAR